MLSNNVPVKLEPVFFTHIWGGTLLKEFLNKDYASDNVGESWEVSAHPNGNSIIASGQYKDMEFGEYYKKVLGHENEYPLLIKLIGPKKDLSVQVHPNDTYAMKHENSLGKKEAWYVLSSTEGSQIVAGINSSKDEFIKVIDEGRVKDTLNYFDCSKGDTVVINPGMVHALLKDVIVYEVQQNSNITYRIYDWDRIDEKTKEPRQLHIDKALDVIDFDMNCEIIKENDSEYQILADNEYFKLVKINFDGEYIDTDSSPGAYTLIEGNARIVFDDIQLFTLTKGDSFYAPIGNKFKILGKGEMLKSTEK